MYSPESRRDSQDARLQPCPRCGEPERLTRRNLCYACDCRERGTPEIEQHHMLGKANSDDTVPMPVNMHREITRLMFLWPEPLKTNPENNPLITIAQELQARHDIDRYLAARGEPFNEWFVARHEHAVNVLLIVNELLIEHAGENWHEGIPTL